MKGFLRTYYPGILLTLFMGVIALFTFKDYGISWDERIQREIGMVSYDYINKGDSRLFSYDARDHGTGFELPLVYMEQWLHITESRQLYLARHLATHLFFLFGVFCGYVLALRLYRRQGIAILAFFMLALSPRIYAHSFFNSKDVPFMSAMLMAMLACEVAFAKRKVGWHLLLGICCGYAASIRIMGIIIVPIVLSFLLIDFALGNRKERLQIVGGFVLYLAGFCGMLVAAWPVLWPRPLAQFAEQFTNLAHYPWIGDLLLNGHMYKSNALPWFYAPEWFAVTTPVLFTVAGLAGGVLLLVRFVGQPVRFLTNTPQRNQLLYAACAFGPVAAVIAMHSILYDDWRHLYFVYPPFVLLGLYAVHAASSNRLRTGILVGAFALQTGYVAWFMVSAHPFQQVYFNHLVSHKEEYLRRNFEFEYWGCAYSDAVRYILAHDKREKIKIDWSSEPVANAVLFLPKADAARIELVDRLHQPDYFITGFRQHPGDYPDSVVFWQRQVLNSTVVRVYKK